MQNEYQLRHSIEEIFECNQSAMETRDQHCTMTLAQKRSALFGTFYAIQLKYNKTGYKNARFHSNQQLCYQYKAQSSDLILQMVNLCLFLGHHLPWRINFLCHVGISTATNLRYTITHDLYYWTASYFSIQDNRKQNDTYKSKLAIGLP